MSLAVERWKIGYGRFLADPVGYYEKCIEQNEEKIKRYERFIEKLRTRNKRLETLKKTAEQGLMSRPNIEEALESYRQAVME